MAESHHSDATLREPCPHTPPRVDPVAVGAAIRATPWRHAFVRLRVEAAEGRLRLTGCVASYHLKQMAQALAARESPPRVRIDNRLLVCPAWRGCSDPLDPRS